MTLDKIVVDLVGLAVIAFIVWFFWLVKGGYTPDLIVVEHGRPVRLNFRREESASCSEMVLLPDFQKSASLPQGEVVPIEFLPEKPGEYGFQCQMGMFRGKLIVE